MAAIPYCVMMQVQKNTMALLHKQWSLNYLDNCLNQRSLPVRLPLHFETLNHMSDRQLEDIGSTRATYVEQIKANVLAQLDAQDAAKAASAPVNANLVSAV